MFDTESDGDARGSLKDRLRFLNILMRISRQKKLRLNFYNINAMRLSEINRMYLFFYNPARIILGKELKTNNTILYKGVAENSNFELKKESKKEEIEPVLIERVRKKKGIAEAPKIEAKEQSKTDVKEEISKKYNIPVPEISDALVQDYIEIKNNAAELFDGEISETVKEALLSDRVKAEPHVKKVHKVAELEKDLILGREVEYDLKQDKKATDKLAKALDKQKDELERILREINKYTVMTESSFNLLDITSLISNTIGLGLGLLTLPFSSSRAFTLGTNLMRKSIKGINKYFEPTPIKVTRNYEISLSDIESALKSLKSSDFLLEDILDKLDHLKYKLKLYDYKVPELDKKLKEIETLEKGLAKKKRELSKMLESMEKSKVKVMERDKKGIN